MKSIFWIQLEDDTVHEVTEEIFNYITGLERQLIEQQLQILERGKATLEFLRNINEAADKLSERLFKDEEEPS